MKPRDIYILVAWIGVLLFFWLMAFAWTFAPLGLPGWLFPVLGFTSVSLPGIAGWFIRCEGCDEPINRYTQSFGGWKFKRWGLIAPAICPTCGRSWVDDPPEGG